MNNKPLVSFIIPFYNGGVLLQETIDSIFKQSYQNFEIWIVNDGSTDDASLSKLESLFGKPKIKIIHQDNAGPSVARNNAIKQAKGEIIVPLDADDLVSPNALETAISVFSQNPSVDVVYGNLQFFGGKNEIKTQTFINTQTQFIYNQLAVCCFIKKAVFDKVGYYDEFLSKPGLEDWEFWIRVSQHGCMLKKVDEVFFNIRINEDSRTFKVANKNVDMIKEYVFKKHALFFAKEYENVFYQKKMLAETPDYRIGGFFLAPWRFLKQILTKKG